MVPFSTFLSFLYYDNKVINSEMMTLLHCVFAV